VQEQKEDRGTALPAAENKGLRPMDKAGFSRMRVLLGKSQRDLAGLLGISLKAVESYEQGWRGVPSNVERMLYFLLFKVNETSFMRESPCWTSKSCSEKSRKDCLAYATGEGHFCWFFTGGLCASAKASGIGERYCYGCVVFSRLNALVEKAAGPEAGAGGPRGFAEARCDDWSI